MNDVFLEVNFKSDESSHFWGFQIEVQCHDLIPNEENKFLLSNLIKTGFTYDHSRSLAYQYMGKTTKFEARERCSEFGSDFHLPIPISDDENSFYQAFYPGEEIWLDFKDLNSGGRFVTQNNLEIKNPIPWLDLNRYFDMEYWFYEFQNSSISPDFYFYGDGTFWYTRETDKLAHAICIIDIHPYDCTNISQGYNFPIK